MKVLIISNIPSPYRIDFFNELGKAVDLTVIFEAKLANEIKFNWNLEEIKWFKAKFLKESNIEEKKVDWSILKYIKKNYYDVIIVTSYAYLTEMVALLTLKFKKIPYYLEIDGGLIRTDENYFKSKLKSFLISNAKGYFSPSKSSDDFLVYYGADREQIYRYPFTSLKREDILNEVIQADEKSVLKKQLNIQEEKVVLSVGRFIHGKGFDVLLNACNEIGKDIGVYIVGGNPTDEYVKLKNKYNLTNVHFIGFKTKEELKNYYKAADLFVLPTRGDVWGLVINEAMCHGLPVITTDKCVAGIELIENYRNGFIVPVDHSGELSEKMNIILEDMETKNNMSNQNLEVIRKYTIENMVNKHLEILKVKENSKFEFI
ncbi:glycosyltransferase family 4 protein [Psychrobacillus sp. NPDC093180]|uniref:glycosyltransferase family 4 protein n=1 Tax=Psychrobacillus sp. NPDC093180 TaxID=3364489 RepID=UPI0037FBF29D